MKTMKPVNKKSYQTIKCPNCNSSYNDHEPLIKTKLLTIKKHKHMDLDMVACRTCGLAFQNPQLSYDLLSDFYTDHYAYREDFKSKNEEKKYLREFGFKKREMTYPWVQTYLPNIKNQTILDIGCDIGLWLDCFDDSNKKIGIEMSKKASTKARELFDIEVHEEDYLKNSFEKGTFDFITGTHVLEHFLNPLEALVESNKLLKAGGHIHIEVPSVKGLVFRQGYHASVKAVHTYYFSAETLTSLFEKAGFKVIGIQDIPAYRPNINIASPHLYGSGWIGIIGEKVRDQTYDGAVLASHSSNDFEAVRSEIKEAIKIDKNFLMIEKLKLIPVIGFFTKALHKIIRDIFGKPVDRKDFLLEIKKEVGF